MTNISDHIPRLFCEFDRRDQVSLDATSVWRHSSSCGQ